MGTLAINLKPLAQEVSFTEDEMSVLLVDGRTISAPLLRFPLLSNASLKHYTLVSIEFS